MLYSIVIHDKNLMALAQDDMEQIQNIVQQAINHAPELKTRMFVMSLIYANVRFVLKKNSNTNMN